MTGQWKVWLVKFGSRPETHICYVVSGVAPFTSGAVHLTGIGPAFLEV